jgi:DNA polymerase-3 subunit delta'
MVHPDVHVLFPYPKGTDEDDVAARIQRLGDEPYAPVDYVRRPSLDDPEATSNKQVMYHIERVHDDLLRPMSFRPVEGRAKVALVTDVELMRPEGANAFLKLLEEPPPQTVFVLTTSRPEQLLPTIVSRCQRLRFDPLAPEAIEAALVERRDTDPRRAAMLARMADGSYTRALELASSEELLKRRAEVLAFLRTAYRGDAAETARLASDRAREGRERVKGLLTLMLAWLRDLLLMRTTGTDAHLVNVDQAQAARDFVANLPHADLEGMVALVEDALHLATRNVRLGLVLTVLAQAMRRAMRGQQGARLVRPLPEAGLVRVR